MRGRTIPSAALALLAATTAAAQQPGTSPPSAAPKPPAPYDSLALARRATIWFYTGLGDSLVAHSSAELRQDPHAAEQYLGQLTELAAHAGTEVEVLEEKFVRRRGRTQYWRTARFSDVGEPMLLRWVLLPGGEIGGMGLGPKSQAPPIDPPATP